MKKFKDIRIVSVGDLVMDTGMGVQHLPIEAGKHQDISFINIEPGGAGNYIYAAAHMGADISIIGVTGDDFYGQEMLRIFAESGLSTKNITVQTSSTTTVVFVLGDNSAQHVFLAQIGQGPPDTFHEHWKKTLEEADAIHTYGYTLEDPRFCSAMLDCMEYALKAGKEVVFDPGPYVISVPFAVREAAMRRSSIIMLTEDEIHLLVPSGKVASDAQKLLSDTVKLVVVKRGAHGAVAFTHDGITEHNGFPVNAVDTSGCGDSFAAAFIVSYCSGMSLESTLAIANAMGAAKASKTGSGRNVPTLEEIQKFLDPSILADVI